MIETNTLDVFLTILADEGLPVNIVLEMFMESFVNGEYLVAIEYTIKYFPFDKAIQTRNKYKNMLNEDLHAKFKEKCKDEGYKMSDVIEAFIKLVNQKKMEIGLIYKP